MTTESPPKTETQTSLEWTEENLERIEELKSHYPDGKEGSAVQEVLRIAQHQFGEINEEIELLVAETLDISSIRVHEVVQFYENVWEDHFPEKRLEVCTGLSCQLRGAHDVLETICEYYDVYEGEVDEEKDVLVKEMECLAACDGAPAMLCNEELVPDLDEKNVEELLEQLDSGEWTPDPMEQEKQKRPESSVTILTAGMDDDDSHTLEHYRSEGGYETARDVLNEMEPEDVQETVKEGGVQGRGGAGFPAGVKWSFVPDPEEMGKPVYLTVNADESEPGTFKDRMLMEEKPHLPLEGIIICSYAVKSHTSYIYIRGEFGKGFRRMKQAIDEAYEAGIFGDDVLGTGYELNVYPNRDGGAYICGEETAMLTSLEGRKALPRNRPPFPAVKGLYDCPTVVNNLETLSNVPAILKNGPDWYKSIGEDEDNPGSRMFCVSGDVANPGVYEEPLDINAEELVYDVAGGIRNGNEIKAFIPGGASAPVLTPDEMDVSMGFTTLDDAGSMAGSGGVMVVDETRCMVRVLLNLEHFFYFESCGQCTPCREGTGWTEKIVERIENGNGRMEDIELLEGMSDRVRGTTICALADAAMMPLDSFVSKYKDEFVEHIEREECPFE